MADDDPLELTCAGVLWRVEPQWAHVLRREVFEPLAGLGTHPRVEQIKHSNRRTIYRVPLSDGRELIVKIFRLASWRERLKERVLGAKPAIEWRASRRLLTQGISASHAIALGIPATRGSPIEGYLVVDASHQVLGLNDYIALRGTQAPANAVAAQLDTVQELAAWTRRLHDAGVRHHDLHGGNILARLAPSDGEERFVAIDLHRIHIGSPPGAAHREEAIALLLRTLTPDEAAIPQLPSVFLNAYTSAASFPPSAMPDLQRILARMQQQEARRRKSRARRCLKNSSVYAVERLEGWRIHHRRDVPASQVLALIERHRRHSPAGAGAPTPVSRLQRGESQIEIREYPAPGFLGLLWHRLFGSPGLHAYAAAHRAWIATGSGPRPVAAAHRLRQPGRGASFALIEPAPTPK